MRLSGLIISATVSITAAQVPVVEIRQTIQSPQPPRDVVKRAEPTGTARIRGRVVSADRGVPVRRASVSLMSAGPAPAMRGAPPELAPGGPPTGRSNQPMTPRRATTDSDGQFEFAGLPAGSYRIIAAPAQYSSQYLSMSYGANRPMGMYWAEQGQSIELKDGESFDKVVISLPRGGIITGRVTDENAEPLARVQVYTMAFPPGMSRAQRTGGGTSTDDLGQFRLWGLNAGEFIVVADARSNSFVGPNAPPETEEDRTGYVTTYYPGTLDEGMAQRVRVKIGEEVQGIDIRVGQARLYHVSGFVVDSKGRPLAGANGQLMRRGATVGVMPLFGMSDAKGQFQMRNVPPGEYRLVFRQQQQNMVPFSPDTPREPVEMASVPISVAGADVDNIMVTTSLGTTITGQVVFEGVPPTGHVTNMRVFASPSNPEDAPGVGSAEPGTVTADYRFTLKGLMGEYVLRTGIQNHYLKSVTANGEDVTDVGREFKASDRVTITMTSTVGTIEGNVTDTRDVQLPEAGVILFSEDKASWRINSIWTKRTGFDQKGHFRITGLMPGRYYVAALPRQRLDISRGGGVDVAFFEQLAKEATLVVVGADEQRTVDLRMLDAYVR
ncbi:MAG TPA: carboxypeptidase regulatory-like domain-containing protein [Vicinamibacterales bacterium]|nr:carboxypeptidase regulatory-like domain-containing protein [Vicinamibacterales bacterium]